MGRTGKVTLNPSRKKRVSTRALNKSNPFYTTGFIPPDIGNLQQPLPIGVSNVEQHEKEKDMVRMMEAYANAKILPQKQARLKFLYKSEKKKKQEEGIKKIIQYIMEHRTEGGIVDAFEPELIEYLAKMKKKYDLYEIDAPKEQKPDAQWGELIKKGVITSSMAQKVEEYLKRSGYVKPSLEAIQKPTKADFVTAENLKLPDYEPNQSFGNRLANIRRYLTKQGWTEDQIKAVLLRDYRNYYSQYGDRKYPTDAPVRSKEDLNNNGITDDVAQVIQDQKAVDAIRNNIGFLATLKNALNPFADASELSVKPLYPDDIIPPEPSAAPASSAPPEPSVSPEPSVPPAPTQVHVAPANLGVPPTEPTLQVPDGGTKNVEIGAPVPPPPPAPGSTPSDLIKVAPMPSTTTTPASTAPVAPEPPVNPTQLTVGDPSVRTAVEKLGEDINANKENELRGYTLKSNRDLLRTIPTIKQGFANDQETNEKLYSMFKQALPICTEMPLETVKKLKIFDWPRMKGIWQKISWSTYYNDHMKALKIFTDTKTIWDRVERFIYACFTVVFFYYNFRKLASNLTDFIIYFENEYDPDMENNPTFLKAVKEIAAMEGYLKDAKGSGMIRTHVDGSGERDGYPVKRLCRMPTPWTGAMSHIEEPETQVKDQQTALEDRENRFKDWQHQLYGVDPSSEKIKQAMPKTAEPFNPFNSYSFVARSKTQAKPLTLTQGRLTFKYLK